MKFNIGDKVRPINQSHNASNDDGNYYEYYTITKIDGTLVDTYPKDADFIWCFDLDGIELIEQDTKEETQEEENYSIGVGKTFTIKMDECDNAMCRHSIDNKCNIESCHFSAKIEETPTDKEIATDTSFGDTTRTHTDFSCKDSGIVDPPTEKCCDETVGLDYEKEYELLLEEYEELNEELYIAKTAIKMISELL